MYHHLTRDQRIALATLLRADHSQRSAAKELGIDQSTISRELKRNPTSHGTYHASHANVLARQRRKHAKAAFRKIENDPRLAARIASRLHPLVSPEVIAHDERISHETIYAWLYRSRRDLVHLLPQRGKKRRRYGSKRAGKQGWTTQVRAINLRSPGAERRRRIGHFEGDTILGRHGALLTLTDRKSRFEIAVKIAKKCDAVHAALVQRKARLHARSFTFDRGSEFALWKMVEEDMAVPIYFAHPHAPWERGSNENANGRLRRIFPKRFDFSTITQREVNAVVRIMNHTKRKCLNWRTPCEVFGRCCTSS